MRRILTMAALGSALHLCCGAAEAPVQIGRAESDEADPNFQVLKSALPVRGDAAEQAVISVIGDPDPNSGGTRALTDGQLPARADHPRANFFFRAGSQSGRVQLDLGSVKPVREVRTFSWHPGERGPQVYALYGSSGQDSSFAAKPEKGTDPAAKGWTLLAKVDTRTAHKIEGGQYAVSIGGGSTVMGDFRYLLLDVERTDAASPFGHTFFSEIDVLDGSPTEPIKSTVAPRVVQMLETEGGKFRISLDSTETPDLNDWVRETVAPMAREWYPKIAKMLASEGFTAPQRVTIAFRDPMQGVAGTVGSRIECAGPWFRQNLKGEALGAVFHELVHVCQQYKGASAPGWLVEGIADYVRWYRFEPKSGGAEIRNIARARHDGSYRITANFLNYVSEQHGQDFVTGLNAAIRSHTYSENYWKEKTGKTLAELNDAWIAHLKTRTAESST